MIRRIFVEKKPEFAIAAKELKDEMAAYLGISADTVRALVRYDIENVSDETYEKAKVTVLGSNAPLATRRDGANTVVSVPGEFASSRLPFALKCTLK